MTGRLAPPKGSGNGSCGPRPGTCSILATWQMRDVNSAGYRLRVLCKPRPRAGLVDSRQTFVRRRQFVPSSCPRPDNQQPAGALIGSSEYLGTRETPFSVGQNGGDRNGGQTCEDF